MCMEDIRIMRKTHSGTSFTRIVVGSATPLVQANKNRVALIISPPLVTAISLDINEVTADSGGIVLAVGSNPLVLSLADHGDLVTRKIFVRGGTAEQIVFWESILDEE